MRKIVVAIVCLFSTNAINAQAPKYSNEFLSIGVGARAQAMANSSVALCDDVTSGFWNPAGLVLKQGDIQLGLQHAELFAGIAKYDYASLAAPVDATRTIGFSFIRFAVDDIIDSTDLIDADGNIDYNRLKSFSAADYAFLFSYSARTKVKGLRVGGNAKVIHRKVGNFATAWGFGLDLGVQYDHEKWHFGAMAKDITTTFNAWKFNTDEFAAVFAQTGNDIPTNGLEITLPKLILGVANRVDFNKKFSMTPELDLDVTFDGKRNVLIKSDPISVDPHLGLEFGMDDFIFLRAGVGNIQQVQQIDNSVTTILQPTLGIGVKIKNVTIDYALTNVGSASGIPYSNIFSLKWNINKKTSAVNDKSKDTK